MKDASSGAARPVKAASKDTGLIQEKRGLLIAAAVRVFKEKGFHDTTVRDIGREANMTQGTIYNYVGSKEDILYLVCDQIVSEYQEEARKALGNATDPLVRVGNAIRAVSEVMYRHQDEILLIYQDSHLLDKRSRKVILARVEEFIGMFEAILRESAVALDIELGDAHLSANILTFLPTMIALRRWSIRPDRSPQEIIDYLSQFMIRGLGFDKGKRPPTLTA